MTTLSRLFRWSASVYFGVPLVISLAVSLVLCVVARTRAVDFPLEVLLGLSRDMLSFLGVITAILIAVITTTYALSEQARREGFSSFLQALNLLRKVPEEIESSSDVIDPTGDGSPNWWSDVTREFISRMNEIRPTWSGYDAEPELEQEMALYLERSSGLRMNMESKLDGSDDGRREVRRLWDYIDQSMRGMVNGLLSMNSGIVSRQFAVTLMKLAFSLALLLIVTLIVRALVGPVTGVGSGWWTWLSLSVYAFLPITAVVHVIGFICATHEWWRSVRKPEKIWEYNSRTRSV